MTRTSLFSAGFREGWRTGRPSESTILTICYVSAFVTALVLILHACINQDAGAHMSNDDLRQKARENWFWIAAVIAIFFGYTVGKDLAIRDRAQAAAMPCPPEAT
jgi:H+/Cl- antiporter ClcA